MVADEESTSSIKELENSIKIPRPFWEEIWGNNYKLLHINIQELMNK